jgi:ribosomal protein RSM22 (predicted rRNA methylase)
MLPEDIRQTIDDLAAKVGIQKLRSSFGKLHEQYTEDPKRGNIVTTFEDHVTYLAFRFPATFAAVREALKRLQERLPAFSPTSILDIGAGPGSALLAARKTFPMLSKMCCLEKDLEFIRLGKRFVPETVEWLAKDMRSYIHTNQYELTIASYSLGELSSMHAPLDMMAACCTGCIVIVEPGTPRGFQTIRDARAYLIKKGWHAVAPCPHQAACPIPEGDFCHFYIRLPRSRIHRLVKGGQLGYEDEKFSYVALVHPSLPFTSPYARILRHPCGRSGHTHFTLCTRDGTFIQKTISKKEKKTFLLAKKAEWGDILQ